MPPASALRIGTNDERPPRHSYELPADVEACPNTCSDPGPTKLPEFLSRATFRRVMQTPTVMHPFLKFAQARHCDENLEFLEQVRRHRELIEAVATSMQALHDTFLTSDAEKEVNLNKKSLSRIKADVAHNLKTAIPALAPTFETAKAEIEELVFTDIFPKFVRHQVSVSAGKALGANQSAYSGLGDCFILTDPAKIDNPIAYVSDGFVHVTGYTGAEVIHSNCRFLRTPGTDSDSVARIRRAIAQREECVELLLNQKKGGQPFWNLLYIAPLLDAKGKLAFFLGAQVDCSAAAHDLSDVLRTLSQPVDRCDPIDRTCDTETQAQYGDNPHRYRTVRDSLRIPSRPSVRAEPPGAGGALLERLENMSFDKQLGSVYLTYSKFLIFDHSSYRIAFVSRGTVDSLCPLRAKATTRAQAVGLDVFRFLSNHSSGAVPSNFKSAVKGSLKAGRAITLELNLAAEPAMLSEAFKLHWTPLKDNVGVVAWVVLTLGNEKQA